MRHLTIGVAMMVAAGMAGCSSPRKPPVASYCPDKSPYSGPTLPSVAYSDSMVVVGQTLKPTGFLDLQHKPGLCVDPSNGDIHLYHKDAKHIVLTLSIDPTVGKWVGNPFYAFETSPNAVFGDPTESSDNQELTVNLLAHDNGKKYPYTAYYVDPNGNVLTTEPGIQNH